jgi:hypothetical protein
MVCELFVDNKAFLISVDIVMATCSCNKSLNVFCRDNQRAPEHSREKKAKDFRALEDYIVILYLFLFFFETGPKALLDDSTKKWMIRVTDH